MGTTGLGVRLSLAALLALSPVAVSSASAEDCVRVVRSISDFTIRGDAWTWWASAEGEYARTQRPQSGSVLVFKRTRSMTRGHVSLVSHVVDRRTILVDHSWLGGRGLRRNMRVVDVSPANDWSQVRVWHEPTRQLGDRVYPIYGFILPDGTRPQDDRPAVRFAVAPAGRGPRPTAERPVVAQAEAGPRRVAPARSVVEPGRKPAAVRVLSIASLSPLTVAPGRKPNRTGPAEITVAEGPLPARKPGSRPADAAPQVASAAWGSLVNRDGWE